MRYDAPHIQPVVARAYSAIGSLRWNGPDRAA